MEHQNGAKNQAGLWDVFPYQLDKFSKHLPKGTNSQNQNELNFHLVTSYFGINGM